MLSTYGQFYLLGDLHYHTTITSWYLLAYNMQCILTVWCGKAYTSSRECPKQAAALHSQLYGLDRTKTYKLNPALVPTS